MQTIRNSLGKRVRYLRTHLGWSQETLAEKAGLHPTYIGGIERGQRNVSLQNLAKLSIAFHVTLAELFQFPEGKLISKDNLLRKRVEQLIAEEDEPSVKLLFTLQQNLQALGNSLQEFEKLILRRKRKR